MDWNAEIKKMLPYIKKPHLKFGISKGQKIYQMITYLCYVDEPKQGELKVNVGLEEDDDVVTILSNVTMGIQYPERGSVWPPEDGGWYMADGEKESRIYYVCPGFAKAWRQHIHDCLYKSL